MGSRTSEEMLPGSVQNRASENEKTFLEGCGVTAEQLIRTAIENLHFSYAPYSGHTVSAAVLMDSGRVYTGVNVENAAYPAGICAENNAISHAVACGERRILAIAIVGGANYSIHDYCAPCGICRQVMREFSDPSEMKVFIARSQTDYKEMTLEELLPESFGPEALQKRQELK